MNEATRVTLRIRHGGAKDAPQVKTQNDDQLCDPITKTKKSEGDKK